MNTQKNKLIVFDVDGVLLDGSMGGIKDILVELGKKKEVELLHEEYERVKSKGPWGLEEVVGLYGGIEISLIEQKTKDYINKTLVDGAQETISQLKKEGCIVGAISSGPAFIMDELNDLLNLDFAYGTEFESADGKMTGRMVEKVDRYKKVEIFQDLIKNYDVDAKSTFVVGDSVTYVPMGKEAGTFIGFCPDSKEVRDISHHIVEKKDLREVLKFIL